LSHGPGGLKRHAKAMLHEKPLQATDPFAIEARRGDGAIVARS